MTPRKNLFVMGETVSVEETVWNAHFTGGKNLLETDVLPPRTRMPFDVLLFLEPVCEV